MKITSSYPVACLKAGRKTFSATEEIYQAAIAYLAEVYNKEWVHLLAFTDSMDRKSAAERLIHSTKNNNAPYDFDARFPKFPSYLRRSARNVALGIVSSYQSNYANWEAGGKRGGEPKLSLQHHRLPCFFKGNMSSWDGYDSDTISLKLYNGSDWVWVTIHLRHTDVQYLKRHWSHVTPSAPMLEKCHGRFSLRFAFEEQKFLFSVDYIDGRICAVDLGLNTDATCCILQPDGTVVARKFINFPTEKDHLWRVLNRIKKKQREHGPTSIRDTWRYAAFLNDELAVKVATAIVDFAVLHSAEVLVFEYLDFRGKRSRGSRKEKLHMWKKNAIQSLAAHKAHRSCMHVSHICAWNTSRLAFDGSGRLQRDKDNYSLATFASGKRYNCDLSASYNIGARYYVRELPKTLPAKERSQLMAKDQGFGRRTEATLATLRKMYPDWLELYSDVPATEVQTEDAV